MKTTALRKVPQSHGGALNSGGTPGNSGGKKGRSGRPPKEFVEFCSALARDPRFHDAIEAAATDHTAGSFVQTAKMVAAYGAGVPTQEVNHGGTLTVRVLRDPLPAAVAARVAARNGN